jgi:hypothetical protein
MVGLAAKAPYWLTASPAEQMVTELVSAKYAGTTKTKENKEMLRERAMLLESARTATTDAEREQASIDAQDFLNRHKLDRSQLAKLQNSAKDPARFVSSFKQLSAPQALDVYEVATPNERKLMLEALFQKLQNFEKNHGGPATMPLVERAKELGLIE